MLVEYSSSYSVCLSCDVGNIYFHLAQTQQYPQTIAQLTHACPNSVLHSPSFYLLRRLKLQEIIYLFGVALARERLLAASQHVQQ